MSQSDWVYRVNGRVPIGEVLPDKLKRFAGIIQYDGNSFCGWQRQVHCQGVQQAVETALSYVANESVSVACAGRTDARVHATNQVIHFDTRAERSGYNWVHGVNANLPDAVRLLQVQAVPAQFHARFSALARTYRYLIINTGLRPAVMRHYLSWEKVPLDIAAMSSASLAFLGKQDFSAVRGAGCQSPTSWRNVHDIRFFQVGKVIVMEITANAFLLHMVRNIVGILLAVGRGEQATSWVAELLELRDRRLAPPTAPAAGLYLVSVTYPEHFSLVPPSLGPDILPLDLEFL